MKYKAYALFKKDLHSELRTRYAINALAMFIIVTLSVILFSIGQEKISESLTGGLFWVVIFFTCNVRTFPSICFRRRKRNNTDTSADCFSFNSIFRKASFQYDSCFCMNIVIAILYSALFEAFVIRNFPLFLISFILGNIGLAVSATIIAAIIAKAGAKGTFIRYSLFRYYCL